MDIQVGDAREFERTFTHEDVRQFTEVSGDAGEHHVEPDEDGRLMVQGLLTATLPTKIGGDLDYIARTMKFEFLRPVFTGDTITCQSEVVEVEDGPERIDAVVSYECTNDDGDPVLLGRTTGVIFQE